MELNRLLFAAPGASYSIDDLPSLLLVPRTQSPAMKSQKQAIQELSHRRIRSHEIRLESLSNSQSLSITFVSQAKGKKMDLLNTNEKDVIPALYIRYSMGSNKILLYFHANAEDLGMISTSMSQISQYLQVNILAIEYPGYGIYKGNPSSTLLLEDANIIYDYTINTLGFKSKDIIVVGRSIGSGPASFLASQKQVCALILISPFKSIKAAVKSAFGRLAALFIADRFKNVEEIQKVSCPILFIHGQKDMIIPVEHSLEMAHLLKKMGMKFDVFLGENFGHNDLSTLQDVCIPMIKFLRKMEIEIKNDVKYITKLPEEAAWKIKAYLNNGDMKRKNSLMKMMMERSLKEV